MGIRSRKFAGMVLTLVFLVGYSLIAMAVGAEWAIGWPFLAQLGFFVVAGLLWLPPVMVIIRWMARPA